MTTVIRSLGETLTLLPAREGSVAPTAGPPFGLTRHLSLLADPAVATMAVAERLDELARAAGGLASQAQAPASLQSVASALTEFPRWAGIPVLRGGVSSKG